MPILPLVSYQPSMAMAAFLPWFFLSKAFRVRQAAQANRTETIFYIHIIMNFYGSLDTIV